MIGIFKYTAKKDMVLAISKPGLRLLSYQRPHR
ncbi:hypothetical protein KLGR111401_16795 [Klebsiella grimontii]